MNFFKFFKDHLVHLFFFLLGMLFLNLVIWIDSGLQMNLNSIIYLDILGLIFVIGFLLILYSRQKNFFNELNYRTKHPEKSYQEPLELGQSNTAKMYQNAYNSLIHYNRDLNNNLVGKITDQQDFITKWIHEIKVPIAALQLLIETSSQTIPEKKLAQMKEELKKTNHLVEQVLYYSRLDDFSNDYLIQKYSLKKLVKDVVIENMDYLLLKNITFNLIGEDQEILTDDKWLRFILGQLLSNAIKYTTKNGTITFTIKQENNQVQLELSDSGIGIPPDDQTRIFDKGFTGTNGRTQDTKSTGLGLYLAKQMSQKLGHSLTLKSSDKSGTTFGLIFPFLGYYNDANENDNLKI